MTKLTIGLPAYNNGNTLRASVESLLKQTFQDYRLIISDDNSNDDTHLVATQLAREDSRIQYIRQPKNLKYQNFGFLLRNATTKYFMWAPGDDQWKPEFIEACVEQLDNNNDVVLASPKIAFETKGQFLKLSNGTYPLINDTVQNIEDYLLSPNDNSRMYGIFRTEAGKCSFPKNSFHAYDWAFSAATLRYGKHVEIPKTLMHRDATPPGSYDLLAQKDGRSRITRIFPLLDMTLWLIKEAKIPLNINIISALIVLNLNKHFTYTAQHHRTYHKLIMPIIILWRRHIEWRLLKRKNKALTPL